MATLTNIRPNLELRNVELRNLELPKFDPPEFPSIDVAKTVSDAVGSVQIGRDKRRRLWPMAIVGVVVASFAGWAILSNEALRTRVQNLIGAARQRVQAALSEWNQESAFDPAEPVAFQVAATKPIETAPFTGDEMSDAADYPPGLGSGDGDTSGVKKVSPERVAPSTR